MSDDTSSASSAASASRKRLYSATTGSEALSFAFLGEGNGNGKVKPLSIKWSEIPVALHPSAMQYGLRTRALQLCGAAEPRNAAEARQVLEAIFNDWRRGAWSEGRQAARVPVALLVEAIQLAKTLKGEPPGDTAALTAKASAWSDEDVKALYKSRPDINAAVSTILARGKPAAADDRFADL
jgi:hypothetical protein